MSKQTMANISILLADNDEDFLAICGEFLRSAGYNVLQATGPDRAKEILENVRIHLAILDLRLVNDSDEKDRSGLHLARTVTHSVPKLILTRFPTYQDVVDALKPDVYHLPPAVDFVDKREGLGKLLDAVKQVLSERVNINWDLSIHWEGGLSCVQLVNVIEPTLDSFYFPDRAAELEDLFRQLFLASAQITIGKTITRAGGRVILALFAYDDSGMETQYVVSCGRRTAVLAEFERYKTTIPQQIGVGGGGSVGKGKATETVHFAAIAYPFAGDDLEETMTLEAFYRSQPIGDLLAAVDDLYQVNLGAWYERGRSHAQDANFHDFYRDWLGIDEKALTEPELQKIVADICRKALATGLAQLDYSPRQLTFHPESGSTKAYPNPARFLNRQAIAERGTAQWGMAYGRVDADSVLISRKGRTWLFDFSRAGRAPLLCDFVSLETAVKLDLFNVPGIQVRRQMERQLLDTAELADTVNQSGMLSQTINILSLVENIRQLADELAGCDLEAYLVGLLFCAIARIASYDTGVFHTRRALTPYTHALLTAAMLCQTLSDSTQDQLPEQAVHSLWIDEENKIVWVEGKQIELTIQDFQILRYLYQRAGQLCERQTIVEEALGNEFDHTLRLEESRLNSAMSRLRQKVESNPKQVRYLITVRGRGYKLEL